MKSWKKEEDEIRMKNDNLEDKNEREAKAWKDLKSNPLPFLYPHLRKRLLF